MLTQIRHIQKGTLIVVTIIIVIAFAFLYSDYDPSGAVGSQVCVVKVYERCYRQKEAQKIATNFDVAMRLGMYDFASSLFNINRQDRDPTEFLMSLIVLRKEAERLGIEPTAEEIKASIPKLPIFQQPWVNAEYVQNQILGPNGFTDGDLAQLAKDYLSFQKLRDLIGAGVQSASSEVEREYIHDNQRYTAHLIQVDRKNYVDQVDVSDAKVKEYYEANKANLLSAEKRGFTYAKFTPEKLPEDATNEQKAISNRDFAQAVNRVYAELATDGSDFEKVVKEYLATKPPYKAEHGKFEPFEVNEAPEPLKGDPELVTGLFSAALQPAVVTVPFPQEDGSYYVFRYSELVQPSPLTLEAATPAIKTALKNRDSDQLANEAASAAKAKFSEAIAAGKSVAEAATAAGVKATPLPNFSTSEPPAETDDASLIVGAVDGLKAGEVSDVIQQHEGRGYLLVFVEKIELYKDEEKESSQRTLAAVMEGQVKRDLFAAWLNQRKADSGALARGTAVAPVTEK